MNLQATGNNQRLVLLDVMRAVAVFMMIQGHTIDALLSQSFYNGNSIVFQIWQFGRGLTAPIFLFGSGFAYVIANTRKSVNGKMPLKLIYRRVRWIVLLFGMGVLMHYPIYEVVAGEAISLERWRIFWHVDVLRLIAVTLLGLLAVFLVARNVRQVFWLASGSALAILALTPVFNASGLEHSLPEWLSGYFTFSSGSYFPLFPFSAYLFAGAASASLFKMYTVERPMFRLVKRFAVVGIAGLAVTYVLRELVFHEAGWVLDSASPIFFVFRLSAVMLLWAAVGMLIRKVDRLPKLIPIIGQHTLFIYVFHVMALYGGVVVPGLRFIYGKEMAFYPVFVVIVTLAVVCTGLAYILHDLKNYNIKAYRLVPYAGMVVLAVMLFF